MDSGATTGKPATRAQKIVPVLLVSCVLLVAFWEIMAARSSRPFSAFQITGEDFRAFAPVSSQWSIRPHPLPASPTEPNIVAFEMTPRGAAAGGESAPVLVRLVHGYNMCDCMRIKGYKVEPAAGGAGRRQVWRLASSSGRVSIWATAMIRAGDFSETGVDVRSMPFPRIGIPDDPGWAPRGFTWGSLRHPVDNFRKYIRAKWNNSRCDLATFLGLRQPAWANDELLTLVATWNGPSVAPEDEARVTEHVLAAGDVFYHAVSRWWRERTAPK